MLRYYTAEEKEYILSNTTILNNRIEDLLYSYLQWQNKYARLTPNNNLSVISTYYESLLEFLQISKTKIEGVYEEGESAETSLCETLAYSREYIELVNLKLSAFSDMVSENNKCFDCENSEFAEIINDSLEANSDDIMIRTIALYGEDGKWEELLAKDDDDLTEAEYRALAVIFTMLDNEEAEKFINMLFEESGEYEETIIGEVVDKLSSNYEYYDGTYWKPNNEKIENLQKGMELIAVGNYAQLLEVYNTGEDKELIDQLLNERGELLQLAAVLQTVSEMEQVTSNKSNPGITLTREDGNSIILSYYDIGIIGETICLGGSISPNQSNYCPMTVTISATYDGDKSGRYLEGLLEKEFETRYGPAVQYDLASGQMSGVAVDLLIGETIGNIPVLGMAAGVAIDIVGEQMGLDEDRQYAESIMDRVGENNYYADFELSCTYVVWSDSDKSSTVYIEPSVYTQSIIDKYNELAVPKYDEITMSDVLGNPVEVNEILIEMMKHDFNMYNDITRI